MGWGGGGGAGGVRGGVSDFLTAENLRHPPPTENVSKKNVAPLLARTLHVLTDCSAVLLVSITCKCRFSNNLVWL